MTNIACLLALLVSLAASSPAALVYGYGLFSNSPNSNNNDGLNSSKAETSHAYPTNSHQSSSTHQVISSGSFHTCAITHRNGLSCGGGEKKCGPVKCWGQNNHGQTSIPPGLVLTDVSAGGFFTCGLKVGGEAVCWGEIDHPPRSLALLEETLSREELSKLYLAHRRNRGNGQSSTINGGDYYDQISSGMKHACALAKDGEVHCWGRNDYGESTPPKGTFVQVSAGNSFTCGIRSNGAAECWGKNDAGQSSPPSYPKNIFTQVSASIGGDHACGVLSQDGGVRCWGNNSRGQSEAQNGTFLHVSTGTRTSCGIEVKSQTTSIHCWGGRASTLLDEVELQRNERRLALENAASSDDGRVVEGALSDDANNYHYHHISLGQDHGCALAKVNEEGSISHELECWWMTGFDFDAHRVPVGLELVSMS